MISSARLWCARAGSHRWTRATSRCSDGPSAPITRSAPTPRSTIRPRPRRRGRSPAVGGRANENGGGRKGILLASAQGWDQHPVRGLFAVAVRFVLLVDQVERAFGTDFGFRQDGGQSAEGTADITAFLE